MVKTYWVIIDVGEDEIVGVYAGAANKEVRETAAERGSQNIRVLIARSGFSNGVGWHTVTPIRTPLHFEEVSTAFLKEKAY